MKRFSLETQEWVEEPDPPTIGSLEYLQQVYRDPAQSTHVRLRAATAAVSFEHPKLSAVGFVREVDTFASRLERATLRSDPQGRYYKMIEAQAVEVPDVPQAEPPERDPRDD